MRILFAFILFLWSAAGLQAQKLVLTNNSCKVSVKDLKRIEAILKYEAKLYNNFFNTHLNDTLSIVINLYGNRSDYEIIRGSIAGGLHRTNGFYTTETDQCYVVKNSDWAGTIIHEASHCFLQHNLGKPTRFLTEGIAEFFEMLELDETGNVVFSAQAPRIQMVKQMVSQPNFKLSDYLYAANSQWGEKNQTQSLYSVAYSVVYFLIKKNPGMLKQMLLYLQEGQSLERAIEFSYGGYKNFENEYTDFYRKTLIKQT